ncbi:MAG: DUF4382 domain-containing protein [Gemmatimonadaceae bacterium]
MNYRHLSLGALILAGASVALISACSSSTGPGTGTMLVQLTDAPFSSDSVSRVDIFVVRVDAKTTDADSADAEKAVSDDSAAVSDWVTLGTPKAKIELLALRNGLTTVIGTQKVPAGSYRSFRLIIDPSQSSVTLKNGTVLTSTSTPNVSFPSAARSGIKINLSTPIVVADGGTTTALVDFDVNQSFVIRGSSIITSGLLFKPVIRGTTK